MSNSERTVPAVIEFDIAGLVKGASKGEGWETNFFPTLEVEALSMW